MCAVDPGERSPVGAGNVGPVAGDLKVAFDISPVTYVIEASDEIAALSEAEWPPPRAAD